jgi:hypothetical protein
MGFDFDIPAITSIADIAGGLLDRVWPKQMSAEDKAASTLKFKQLLMTEKVTEINDVANARALALEQSKDAPYLVKLIRGLLRPLAGYTCLTVWVSSVALKYWIAYKAWEVVKFSYKLAPNVSDLLSTWDFGVIMLVFTFFFGTRTIEKNKGTQNRG